MNNLIQSLTDEPLLSHIKSAASRERRGRRGNFLSSWNRIIASCSKRHATRASVKWNSNHMPAVIAPLAIDRYKVQFTTGRETHNIKKWFQNRVR
jgi:hypothetical protein